MVVALQSYSWRMMLAACCLTVPTAATVHVNSGWRQLCMHAAASLADSIRLQPEEHKKGAARLQEGGDTVWLTCFACWFPALDIPIIDKCSM
jgi:hypothetical protein